MASETTARSVVLCGHSKCGTRWLNLVVASNPHVVVVGMHDVVPENEAKLRRLVQKSPKVVYFDIPYSIQNHETLELLTRIDPEMRAVNIYREPVDAMLSMHNYSRSAYGRGSFGGPDGGTSFEEVINDLDFVSSFEQGQLHDIYEAIFRYDKNASNLRQYFSEWKEIIYDDVLAHPEKVLSELFIFMGVPVEWKNPDFPVNKSFAHRSNVCHRIFMKMALLLTGVDTKVFTVAFSRGHMRPSVLYALMRINHKNAHFLKSHHINRLRAVTAPMVSEFRKITGLNLDRWGYSDLRD